MKPERRLELLERVASAFADEIDRHPPDAAVAWPRWPDVRSLVGHLGATHGWAARAIRAGESSSAVPDPVDLPAPERSARVWYLARRAELVDAVRAVPPDAPCWTFTGPDRTAGFWRRRMTFETAKHLSDLRAAGGGRWIGVDELDADGSADGIDELFEVLLARSRPDLTALSAPVVLQPTDGDRRWTVQPDWTVLQHRALRGDRVGPDASIVRGRTADLALFLWDRADPVADRDRFDVVGDPAPVVALRDAAIHP